jgi:hypothetical protein
LFAIIKIYNDVQFISANVESIKDHVEGIIVADGAYKAYYQQYRAAFPDAQPWSTDGSIEVLQSLKGLPDLQLLRVPQGGWPNQIAKMNALIEAVPEGSWFIDVNADEMLVGNVPDGFKEVEESGCVAGRVPLVNLGCDIDRLHYFWHPRLWKHEAGLHFEGTHWQVRDYAGRIVESDYPIWWSQQFVMAHFKPLKPYKRLQPHQAYMATMRDRGWLEPHREELSQEGSLK